MSLAETYRELEADRMRMDYMLKNPDEAASAVADAYNRWDPYHFADTWPTLLREEIDYQMSKERPRIKP